MPTPYGGGGIINKEIIPEQTPPFAEILFFRASNEFRATLIRASRWQASK